MGKAIWRDAGEYGITEIHPDFCNVGDLASGSSLFSLAQDVTHFPGVVCGNESRRDEKCQRRQYIQQLGISGSFVHQCTTKLLLPKARPNFG